MLTTISHPNAGLVRMIFAESGEVLEATPNHSLYSADRQEWIEPARLNPGEHLRTSDGIVTLGRLEPRQAEGLVYNFEVETKHGSLLGRRLFWSHNTDSCGGSAASRGAAELPSRDSTGMVHGELPKPQDLGKYSSDELTQLRAELESSAKTRIAKTVQLGSDPGHGERQAAEQQLIKSIGKHLEDR